MKGNIIVGHSNWRSELKIRRGNVFCISVCSSNSVLQRGTINYIWNEQGVYLSCRSWCQEYSNTLFCDLTGDYLHFEGSQIRRIRKNRADLEPTQEGHNLIARNILIHEGDEGVDSLRGAARTERTRVNLVVSRLYLRWDLSQERKGDLGPLGVCPLRPHNKGNDPVVLTVDRLNRKEEVLAILALELTDR